MTIGERIKQIRKEKRLTLDKFGERIGFGKGAVSMMESGKSNVTNQTILSICREFGVSETWLRNGEGEMYAEKQADELDRILQKHGLPGFLRGLFLRYAKLSPAAQKEVEEQITAWAAEIVEQSAVKTELPKTPETEARTVAERVYHDALEAAKRDAPVSGTPRSGSGIA